MSLSAELREIHQALQVFVDEVEANDVLAPLAVLEKSAHEVEKAWSGSWLGYHSRVYYNNLTPPAPGDFFSVEWGFGGRITRPATSERWKAFDFDAVKTEIHRRAGKPKLDSAREAAKRGIELFGEKRDEIVSILETAKQRQTDPFIERLLEETKKLQIITANDYVKLVRPSGTVVSRDMEAMTQGFWTPPHVDVLAEVFSLRIPVQTCDALAKTALKAASHLERNERERVKAARIGTNVFIGHGRSLVWKDLKDFVHERLRLPWDEFNRIPVAGVTNIARLSEMLDAAAIALIVMTAEDEQVDGTMRARENVIHEAGLFQGRLGFTRAIVLLEEGCEEFSNIHGLGQIRFPKGNIRAVFEEVRQVLEREGLLAS
jgi:predicted nucleotide-binding protein